MKNKAAQYLFIIGAVASIGLSTCNSTATNTKSDTKTAIVESAKENEANTGDTANDTSENVSIPEDVSLENSGIESDDYETDTDNAVSITLADNASVSSGEGVSISDNTVTISKAGTYILNGSLSDGKIELSVGENDVVRLILNGVNINNTTDSAIKMSSGKKLILTLADGTENTVSDGTSYSDTETADATVYSDGSITLNGKGTLNLSANYENGLKAKDNMIIVSGTFNIKSADNAIKGNDLVVIADGTIKINAGGKGITSEGSIYVYDGNIDIENSEEGLEGLSVELYGGTVNMNSTDDGINSRVKADSSLSESEKEAFSAQYQETAYFKLDGATVTINAEGDGIDSNGDVFIESGYILVNGPSGNGNGTFDYNGSAYITGGTYIGIGNGDMKQGFNENSSLASVDIDYDSNIAAGTKVTVSDTSGKEILNFTAQKAFSNLLIADSGIKIGDTITVKAGDNTQEITVSSDSGVSAFPSMGGDMPPQGEFGDGNMPTPPEGGFGDKNGERPAPPTGGMRPEGNRDTQNE